MTLEGSGDKLPALLEEHGHTVEDLRLFSKDPLFEQRVQDYRVQIRENGLSFRLKARVQAEMLLETSWNLIHDRDASPAVRADLIKWTAKVAGLDSSKDGGGDGKGVSITINMGEPSAPPQQIRVIDHE